MKKKLCFLGFVIILFIQFSTSAQSNPCATNNTHDFFNFCSGGTSLVYNGNYTIDIGQNDKLMINGDLTINGNLTIKFQGNTALLQILEGATLKVNGNVDVDNNANSKVIDVDGAFQVTGTLDFSNRPIDIDGTGTISAGAITGAGYVSCSSEGDCPQPFSVSGPCSPIGSGLCAENGTLPITLVSFDVGVAQEAIVVSWKTAMEQNVDHYSIERSRDGKKFQEISKVKVEGNSFHEKDHRLLDVFPLRGKSYYRLRSVDLDGYTETFQVASVNYSGENSVGIFPNPAVEGKTKLMLNFTPAKEYHVFITDLTGIRKSIYSSLAPEIDLDLPTGTYLMKVTSDEVHKVLRIMVP